MTRVNGNSFEMKWVEEALTLIFSPVYSATDTIVAFFSNPPPPSLPTTLLEKLWRISLYFSKGRYRKALCDVKFRQIQ